MLPSGDVLNRTKQHHLSQLSAYIFPPQNIFLFLMWIWYSAEERVDGKSDDDLSFVILQNLIHSVILDTLYLTSKASLICLLLPRSLLTTLVTAKWDAGISRCNSWPLMFQLHLLFFTLDTSSCLGFSTVLNLLPLRYPH